MPEAHRAPVGRRFLERIALFLVLGLLETVAAYFLFERADDHSYFLELANAGPSAANDSNSGFYGFKGDAVGLVFWLLTSPSRLLGGHELVHLIWLRLLTLAGFLCAHSWACRICAPDRPDLVGRSQGTFMVLCLLYPAQLAWTASLLRDGAGCAALFAALLLFVRGRWLLGAISALASLSLRPEFILVLAPMALAVPLSRSIAFVRRRLLLLGGLCIALSMATFEPRQAASEFAVLAFGEDVLAYPSISDVLDLPGYMRVAAQALVDPIALGNPSLSIFPVLEALFFSVTLIASLRELRRAPALAATMMMILATILWLFGYFEVFVSGYSRHRMGPVILILALFAALRQLRRPYATTTPRRDIAKLVAQ